MGIERGPSQSIEKLWPPPISRKIHKLAKFGIHHWKGLKKLCYWWKIGWTIPKGGPVTAVFHLKKGYFHRPISPGVRLTLTPNPHQWKIWTFYLPCIPTLGGWRINAWPTNRPWSELTLPFPENFKYTTSRQIYWSMLYIIWRLILWSFYIIF